MHSEAVASGGGEGGWGRRAFIDAGNGGNATSHRVLAISSELNECEHFVNAAKSKDSHRVQHEYVNDSADEAQ